MEYTRSMLFSMVDACTVRTWFCPGCLVQTTRSGHRSVMLGPCSQYLTTVSPKQILQYKNGNVAQRKFSVDGWTGNVIVSGSPGKVFEMFSNEHYGILEKGTRNDSLFERMPHASTLWSTEESTSSGHLGNESMNIVFFNSVKNHCAYTIVLLTITLSLLCNIGIHWVDCFPNCSILIMSSTKSHTTCTVWSDMTKLILRKGIIWKNPSPWSKHSCKLIQRLPSICRHTTNTKRAKSHSCGAKRPMTINIMNECWRTNLHSASLETPDKSVHSNQQL